MRVGHLDCPSGVSGDMWLGALVDAGAPLAALQRAVDAIGAEPPIRLAERRPPGPFAATQVTVEVDGESPARTWQDIEALLRSASLDEPVRAHALGAFRRLAEAEAAVHGTTTETVTFHEVGSWDAIADVVGACAGVHALALEQLTCGPIATGSGTTSGDHAGLPVPAPAVALLASSFTLHGTADPFELCTPTGMALVAELCVPVVGMPAMRIERQGLGAGRFELDRPNLLRLLVGEADGSTAGESVAVILEATVDDLSPELVPLVLDRLRAAGAHDAWASPVVMKKGRPGVVLTALVDEADVVGLRDLLYRESTTIGTRWYRVAKHALPRRWVEVHIDGHVVRVKIAEFDGEVLNVAPEFDDVRAVSEATDRPARAVYADAAALARERLSGGPT